MNEPQVYLLRPDGTSLYLPLDLANAMRVARGDRMTEAQMNHPQVQDLLATRSKRPLSKKPTPHNTL